MSDQDRFLISVKTSERSALLKLHEYDFDFFQPTAKFSEQEKQFTIDGFLSVDQIRQLVTDGYEVLVKKRYSKQGLPRSENMSFREWIEENQAGESDERKQQPEAEGVNR
ncbi:MAG: hypothetical protein ACM3X1_09350 [Ignavibacteriales bacterium]